MKTHLDEHEITAAVAGLELEPAAAEHLGSCLSCHQQVSALRDAIVERRRDLEGDAPDWDRQRQEIMERLPSVPAIHTGAERFFSSDHSDLAPLPDRGLG